MPPTSTPISGISVNTPTAKPEADGGREAEGPAHRPDDDPVDDGLAEGDQQVLPAAQRGGAADRAHVVPPLRRGTGRRTPRSSAARRPAGTA